MFRVSRPGVDWFGVSCKIGGFNVVPFVVTSVEDPPAFADRYPFNNSADGPVNGGVGDEVGDGNRVAICDLLPELG